MKQDFALKKCAVCGKIFEPPIPEDWVYKAYNRAGTSKLWFCSWGCLRKAEAAGMKKTYDPIKGPKIILSKGGLKFAIAQSGQSMQRLSLKTGRSKSYLRTLLKQDPMRTTMEMAERIADACGVTVSVILKEPLKKEDST